MFVGSAVPGTPFSWTFDSRAGAFVYKSWVSVSEEIFSCDWFRTESLKRKIAAVVSGRGWVEIQ